jgi:hypothetical protein
VLALVGWLALCFAAFGTAVFVSVDGWYASLLKPSWNPPAWVFGPVWTLLYVMMTVAAVIRAGSLPAGTISILEVAPIMGRSRTTPDRPHGRVFITRWTHVDNRQLRMHLGAVQIDFLTEQ